MKSDKTQAETNSPVMNHNESAVVLSTKFLYPPEDYQFIQLRIECRDADEVESDVEDFVASRVKSIVQSVYDALEDCHLKSNESFFDLCNKKLIHKGEEVLDSKQEGTVKNKGRISKIVNPSNIEAIPKGRQSNKNYYNTSMQIQLGGKSNVVTSQLEFHKPNKVLSNEGRRLDQLRHKAKSLLKTRNTGNRKEGLMEPSMFKRANNDVPQADSTFINTFSNEYNTGGNDGENNFNFNNTTGYGKLHKNQINYRLQKRPVKIVKVNEYADSKPSETLEGRNESSASLNALAKSNESNSKTAGIEVETNILALDISPVSVMPKTMNNKAELDGGDFEGEELRAKRDADAVKRSSTSFGKTNATKYFTNKEEGCVEQKGGKNFTLRNFFIRKACADKFGQTNPKRIRKVRLSKAERRAFTRPKTRFPLNLNSKSQARKMSGQHFPVTKLTVDYFKRSRVSPYALPVISFSENRKHAAFARSRCRGRRTDFVWNDCAENEFSASRLLSRDLNARGEQRRSGTTSVAVADHNGEVNKKDANGNYTVVEWGQSRLFKRIVDGHLDVWNAFCGKEFLSESEIRKLLSEGIENQRQVRTVAESTLFTLCGDLNIDCRPDPYDVSEVGFGVSSRSTS